MKNNSKIFETKLREFLKKNDFPYQKELSDFVFSPSKRLRPKLVEAILISLNKNLEPTHYDLMIALELLHSATLIHDDIIDEDILRRGNKTLNAQFGNKISVLVGDFLLSLTLKKLSEINSNTILNLFTSSISNIICGELEQLKDLGEIKDEDSYIKKCRQKTAELFVLSAKTALEFVNYPKNIKENIENFALNFGIAYQIKNDLSDYLENRQDEKNKNYTLPYILASKYGEKCDIIDLCKRKIEEYKFLAQNSIKNLENKKELESFLGYLN